MSDQVHTPSLEQIRHEFGIEGTSDVELPEGVEALIVPAGQSFDPGAVYPVDADEGAPEPGSVGASIDFEASLIATRRAEQVFNAHLDEVAHKAVERGASPLDFEKTRKAIQKALMASTIEGYHELRRELGLTEDDFRSHGFEVEEMGDGVVRLSYTYPNEDKPVESETVASLCSQPDEWNRLHYIAELERIESNLRVWYDPNVTTGRGLVVDQMAEDQATLLAVLRRADAVIRAQAADLAELRQRHQAQAVKFLGVIAEAQEALSAAERALREVA